MRILYTFLYEWKHFTRSPFKIVAVLLFVAAAMYGLHNGAHLYEKQTIEIQSLQEKATEEKETILSYFDTNQKGPEDKPWVDITTPFWAIYNTPTYAFKKPLPAMVYNIGQAEQYGYYKKISIYASPYDADMAKEIANPERIHSGTLDFTFSMLYLLPLLLLVLLYNVKGKEQEQGFLPLVFVQTGSKHWWVLSRTLFYTLLLVVVISCLLLYGAFLTGVSALGNPFWAIFSTLCAYLFFWVAVYFIILALGKKMIAINLQMVGVWLLFAFIVPATVHQWVSVTKPANLTLDLIDVKRDGAKAVYALSDSVFYPQFFNAYPNLKQTKQAQDSLGRKKARRDSNVGLINIAMKEAAAKLETDNNAKNELISNTLWLNPVTYFQNQMNRLSGTHYADYQNYRNTIQSNVDKRIATMLIDVWEAKEVDKERYLEYHKIFEE